MYSTNMYTNKDTKLANWKKLTRLGTSLAQWSSSDNTLYTHCYCYNSGQLTQSHKGYMEYQNDLVHSWYMKLCVGHM